MKKYPQRNFRPWPENEKRLERLSRMGNVSDFLNEMIRDNSDKWTLRKAKEITEEIHDAPIRW